MGLIKPWGRLGEDEKKKCQYGDCNEEAVYQCKMCHIAICERHTRKPGALGTFMSIKLCPDCFKIKKGIKIRKA